MYKKLCVVFLLLMLVVAHQRPVTAEDFGSIRFVQIFYTSADIYLDGDIFLSDTPFTIATDFVEIEVGTHTIDVSATGADAADGSTIELAVEADHHYTILTMGEFETGLPNLLVIDETAAFMDSDPEGNRAIIVQNVPGAPPVDVYFGDDLKIEELSFGGYGTADAPLGQFSAKATAVGHPDMVIFESTYFAVPGTTSLAYLAGAFPDGIGRYFHTTSDKTVVEYLDAHTSLEGSNLVMFYDALKGTELDTQLTDDAQFTIFAPTTAAFEELSALTMAELEEDPLAMAHVLGYHIVPGYLPPASLVGEHDLETLSGETLHVSFTPGESFTVNGNAIGLQHRVTNGAIYLVNVVLLPESE